MNKEKLKELGDAWKVLDEKYDNTILDMINDQEPTPLTPDTMERLKKMQEELFNLEAELFKVLEVCN